MPTVTTRRVYYDLEFIEDGKTIELISIGLVDDAGREYYAVNSEAPMDRILGRDWLVRNVLPSLPISGRGLLDKYLAHSPNTFPRPSLHGVELDTTDPTVRPAWVIANEVRAFLTDLADDPREAELWAWYGAFDHVCLSWLWGAMVDHPTGVPMWTNDLKQEQRRLGVQDDEMPAQPDGVHNALADARHNRVRHDALIERERLRVERLLGRTRRFAGDAEPPAPRIDSRSAARAARNRKRAEEGEDA